MEALSTPRSTDLVGVLRSAGVDVLRVGESEVTGKCPVHIKVVGREDRSPSWSMNTESGLWICFSCGARGTLSSLLYELTGTAGVSAQQHLIEAGVRRLTTPQTRYDNPTYVDEDAFFKFERVSDSKCFSRNLDPDLVFRYGVRWNRQNKSWVIPILSITGKILGWQEKKPGWFRNFPVGVKKGDTLFGVERFSGRTAVIVESPLDVVRFASVYSKPMALATFGAQVTRRQLELLLHVADTVVVAMDNDDAGIASSMNIYKSIGTPRRGLRWWNYQNTDAKDIGEMSDDQIETGYLTASIVPPWVK